MSHHSPDLSYARASIKSLSPNFTVGTQEKPFGSVIIKNDSYYKALNSAGAEKNLIGLSSSNITYIGGSSTIGIAPSDIAKWFFYNDDRFAYNQTNSKITANTSASSDTFEFHICGGGDASWTRGSYISLYGDDHPTSPGRLYLYSGSASGLTVFQSGSPTNAQWAFDQRAGIRLFEIKDTGCILNAEAGGLHRFYINNVEKLRLASDGNLFYGNTDFQIRALTSDGSDTSEVTVAGGNVQGSAFGAYLRLSGNESANTGSISLVTGAVSGANIDITNTTSDGKISLKTNNVERWFVDQFGQLNSAANSIRLQGSLAVLSQGVADGIAAAGSTSADAYALTQVHTRISTGPIGSGVRLADIWGGAFMTVWNNTGGTTVKVYPHTGGNLNALGTDVGYDLASGEIGFFIRLGTKWYGFKVAI